MKHPKLVGTVSNCAVATADEPTTSIDVTKLVGAVSNCAVATYHGTYAVRLSPAPTEGENVHLFSEFTLSMEGVLYADSRAG